MVFFFSSRRRHTRSLCDWSSDVCSSDLPPMAIQLEAEEKAQAAAPQQEAPITVGGKAVSKEAAQALDKGNEAAKAKNYARSEERRVGKECRSRRWWYHEKTKNRRYK